MSCSSNDGEMFVVRKLGIAGVNVSHVLEVETCRISDGELSVLIEISEKNIVYRVICKSSKIIQYLSKRKMKTKDIINNNCFDTKYLNRAKKRMGCDRRCLQINDLRKRGRHRFLVLQWCCSTSSNNIRRLRRFLCR